MASESNGRPSHDRIIALADIEARRARPGMLGRCRHVVYDRFDGGDRCFRDGENGFAQLPFFFVPKGNLQGRADRDQVPYPRWAQEGHITATEGKGRIRKPSAQYLEA
jgi:hypothetical protein